MIISLGYRIKSFIGTQFRRWVTERIKEYMIKGFTVDDERLNGNGGGNYWKELLDRIRDIRSSEKVLYRQVLDLYAMSVQMQRNHLWACHSLRESCQLLKIQELQKRVLENKEDGMFPCSFKNPCISVKMSAPAFFHSS